MPSRTCFIALLLIASAAISASATTYHVPGDAPTIQAGIDFASYGDTVLVACGTYYEHDIEMKSGISLLSETGDADCATIDAAWGGRVLYCENVDENTLIKGLTLAGGYLEGDGGGIYCRDHSSPVIESCIIRDNLAFHGAGIYCGLYSSPIIESCIIRYNSAATGGGGMYCTDYSSPTLTGVTFENNGAGIIDSGYPGGLYCRESSSPRLTDCAFIGNSGDDGSGMRCDSGSAVLERVIFEGNQVFGTGADGGTMVCTYGTATLIDVIFSGNGGGEPYGSLVLGSCTEAMLTRVTFAGNEGDAAHFSGCSPIVTSCTFYENSTWFYGPLVCTGGASPVVEQTIIAFNAGAVYCDPGSQPVLVCCDIFGNEGGDWVGSIEDQFGLNGNISEDPLFCDPENDDLALQEDSPCAPLSPPNEECDLIGAWPVACQSTSADEQEALPNAMHLAPSVPNPCSPSTRITYMIPGGTDASTVLLRIYDHAGRVVRTLTEATQPPGVYTATWDGTNQSGTPVAGGVYFYQLKVNGEIQTRRMTLVR